MEQHITMAPVTITVVPMSHRAPQFTSASYSAVIGENSSRGTAVANISVRC